MGRWHRLAAGGLRYTHFAERRRRSSTKQRAICPLFRSSSDIQRSGAPSAIAGSMSKTRSPWRRALRYSGSPPALLASSPRSWHLGGRALIADLR
jgi:hypothetical protein